MQAFTLGELSVAVVGVIGALVMVLKQIQHSRCKTCSVCCGMVSCDRDVLAPEPEDPAPVPSVVVSQ